MGLHLRTNNYIETPHVAEVARLPAVRARAPHALTTLQKSLRVPSLLHLLQFRLQSLILTGEFLNRLSQPRQSVDF